MGFYKRAERWVFPDSEYEDVMAALDAVAGHTSVDPDRLYVSGQSAGGLINAWIIGRTDRFVAAVVTAPMINYISHYLTHDLYRSDVGRYFAKVP